VSTTYLPLREAGWRHRIIGAALIALSGVLALTLLAPAAEAAKRKKPHTVKVMTRNLYLGADLSDASTAATLDDLCDEAGEVYRDVAATNFPKRAKALAAEILNKKPDLVGLQEGALWREQSPADQGPILGGTNATTVTYDFIKILLNRLNKGPGSKYKLVTARDHFDFEVSANADGVGNGCAVSELDGRLTMRDAILKRLNAGVRTSKPAGGTYSDLFEFTPVGVPYPVKRGWVSVNAKVRGSKPFKFIDTHFEAFDNGTIRNRQAQELVAGPGAGKGRKILVGDLNSDPTDNGGSKLAFNTVVAAGFKDRTPASFTTSGVPDELLLTGTLADFDRRIDHVLSKGRGIRRVKATVFGKQRVNGLFPSDHAGVQVVLRVP
jgi:hypothetical protein